MQSLYEQLVQILLELAAKAGGLKKTKPAKLECEIATENQEMGAEWENFRE